MLGNLLVRFGWGLFVIEMRKINSKIETQIIYPYDNTLIEPFQKTLDTKIYNLLMNISKKFQIIILSNASQRKLKKILEPNWDYIYLNVFRKKPSSWGFKKVLDLTQTKTQEIVMIGDQLATDIKGANKLNIISILVKPLNKKQENLFTKYNRIYIERPLINLIRKTNLNIYNKKFKNFIK
ncbi:YqeG family HAD IIIA-type phosphatase [Candidatus Phytoplasma bonamiae]|uniref:HAD-IA family hydrolase n=1 Tax=Candidatus Phytoplasma bonamiae TaxID=2982626 RepID=A0ABT9D465_9MOLU|nr:HAD-IA family hydrolase ['Bonamia sp.' little leaf phytoplasma]MDO8064236.1 HAD-IA family hydrolase ['Bonamia sp.' little leaf phytoplasma]